MRYYLYVLLIIVIYSCERDTQRSDFRFINVNCKKQFEKKKVFIDKYCCNRKFIRLETTKESIFTDIKRLIIQDNKIIIFDRELGAVFFFDDTGKFLRKIMHIGKGPNEWVKLNDITIYNNKLVMHCAIPEKLIYYNLEGDYLREERHKFENVYISSINNSMIYASYTFQKSGNRNYIKIDNGKNVKEYMHIESHMIKKHFYGKHPNLIKSSGLFFYKSWDSNIYKVNEKGCFPAYKISLKGKDFIEGSKYNNHSIKEFRKDSENILKINDFRDSKSYVTFTMYPHHGIIFYDKGIDKATIVRSFYDREIGISLTASNYIGHDGENEQILFSIDAIQFINKMNKNKQLNNKYKKIANELTPNDNPIIIMYDYK